MLTLGIETSERSSSIALLSDEMLLAERTLLPAGRRHAQSLVAEVNRLFRDYSRRPADVELIAVSRGPGSFTGLRIGLTCAKTLAYAARATLVPVETFAAVAANTRRTSSTPIAVIANAQRGEFFAQQFQPCSTCLVNPALNWKPLGAIAVMRPEELHAAFSDAVYSGPGVDLLPDLIRQTIRVTTAGERFSTASMVARLGIERPAEEQIHPDQLERLAGLEPIYIRRSAAEDQWDARNR